MVLILFKFNRDDVNGVDQGTWLNSWNDTYDSNKMDLVYLQFKVLLSIVEIAYISCYSNSCSQYPFVI